nr:hypothetical protein [Tanacetum cinerariifolium]
MDTTIDQQVAIEALVPHARRLRIGRSNFCLLSDISFKESTLQLVYDVLRLTPFFKAFLVTTDVLQIYMQEFWATATVYHHCIWFKMDNKKHIVNLESFIEMLHICPRLPGQSFVEPPFEEEILAFLRFLRHSEAIRKLTDVNINKLRQPWRSFVAIINKCLTEKSSGYDSLRLSQAQILWGLYHKRNVDFAYLMNSDAYKEYYAVATEATPPKTKASVRKTRSSSDTTVTPPTAAAGPRLSTSAKGKQPATTSKAKSLIALSEEAMKKAQQLKLATKRNLQQTHISQASGSGADEGTGDDDDNEQDDDDKQDDDDAQDDDDKKGEGNDEDDQEEGSFDPIPKTPKNTDDESNGEENLEMNVGREEGQDEEDEDEEDELYRDVNINLGRGVQMADVHTTQEFKDSHVILTPVNPDGIESIFETTSQMDVQTLTSVAPLPVSAPTLTPSTIATITTTLQASTPPTIAPSPLLQYLPNFGSLFGFDHRLKKLEADFSEFMQTNQFGGASDRLCDEAQAENDEFLKTIDENIQKIIKEQVKEQVKTSYVVAADLSEMELNKILIKKMEGNKSIHRSNEQRNLYKALDDDADKDEEPSAGLDRGSKRRREGKEPESASAPKEKATRSTDKSTQVSKSCQTSASKSATTEKRMQTTHEMEEPSHPEFETCADDQPIVESSQHPEWFSQQKKPPTPDLDTLTPGLLAGPTNELMKESCKSLVELEFFLEEVYKATPDQLDWVNPEGASSRKYTTSVTKTKAADYGHIKWIEDLVPRTTIIAVIELKIVEWHNYKPLDWITVCRDDDKLYKFKEGDFKRLRIQDIEDMLLHLVQGKLINLTVKERFAFNVSL